MKFSLLLILPCFLTISAASYGSFSAIEGATFSESEKSSIVASTQSPNHDTAHRGSGRVSDVLAHAFSEGNIAQDFGRES